MPGLQGDTLSAQSKTFLIDRYYRPPQWFDLNNTTRHTLSEAERDRPLRTHRRSGRRTTPAFRIGRNSSPLHAMEASTIGIPTDGAGSSSGILAESCLGSSEPTVIYPPAISPSFQCHASLAASRLNRMPNGTSTYQIGVQFADAIANALDFEFPVFRFGHKQSAREVPGYYVNT